MKAEYKRDLQNNFLIFKAEEETEEDSYSAHMIERNQIPGLLPLTSARLDGILSLNYEITGRQPLAGLYERNLLSYSDILFILTGTEDVLETLQKYLLSPEKLVFDPQFIYTAPEERKLQFCYAPGIENDAPIRVLAEFILKRLDHRDKSAVAIGYQFYEKTQQENFSLQKALREILPGAASGVGEAETSADAGGNAVFGLAEDNSTVVCGGGNVFGTAGGIAGGAIGAAGRSTSAVSARLGSAVRGTDSVFGMGGGIAGASGGTYRMAGSTAHISDDTECAEAMEQRGMNQGRGESAGRSQRADKDFYGGNQVVHKERSGKKQGRQEPGKQEAGKKKLTDRIFQVVHPAVLVSTLGLLAALEAVFYLGYLSVTEAGGTFFLILSVELLANSYWQNAKERKRAQSFTGWEEEEDSEEYRKLQQEMYGYSDKYADNRGSRAAFQTEDGPRYVTQNKESAGRVEGQPERYTGTVGAQGAQYTGRTGAQRAQYAGRTGTQGAQYTGRTGAQGAQYTGRTGAQGAQYTGRTGAQGAQYTGRTGVPAARYTGNVEEQTAQSVENIGGQAWRRQQDAAGISGSEAEARIQGETCCLTDLASEEGMRLIYVPALGNEKEQEGQFPDIFIGEQGATIGKIANQCDILLKSNAVSRLHARLERRRGQYCIQDLNSRNGTFLNGERLLPQEMRIFYPGDRIAFANLQYKVVE